MTLKQAKILAASAAGCFLLIHVAMLILFAIFKVTPMVYFNIFSIAFYIFTVFVSLKLVVFRFYVISVYLEVVLHMSAAIFFTGWDGGFQVTLIGLSFLVFYSYYVGCYLHLPVISPVLICSIGVFAYIGMCVVTHLFPPAYPFPDKINFYLQIFWGIVVFAISIFFLYTFIKLTTGSEELLSKEVGHDKLTGLPNRYYMSDSLELKEQSGGLDGYWIAMMDIDDFKLINDNYGHICGDYILKELSMLLQQYSDRAEICRWGGEEFLLLGKEENSGQSVQFLESLRKTIGRHDFRYESEHIDVSVTIGIAEFTSETTFRQCLDLADQRLYEGKNNGKNQVVA